MCFRGGGDIFVIGIGKFVVLRVRIFEREIVILNCDLLCFLLLESLSSTSNTNTDTDVFTSVLILVPGILKR